MKRLFLCVPFILFAVLFCSYCTGGRNVKIHSLNPYDSIDVYDRDLSFVIFTNIKKELINYTVLTLESVPEVLGVILELKGGGYYQQDFNEIIKSPAERGWFLIDKDIFPFTDEDIAGINMGEMDMKLKGSPAARFFVRIDEDIVTVYVRYWIRDLRSYNHVYEYRKFLGSWNMVKSEKR